MCGSRHPACRLGRGSGFGWGMQSPGRDWGSRAGVDREASGAGGCGPEGVLPYQSSPAPSHKDERQEEKRLIGVEGGRRADSEISLLQSPVFGNEVGTQASLAQENSEGSSQYLGVGLTRAGHVLHIQPRTKGSMGTKGSRSPQGGPGGTRSRSLKNRQRGKVLQVAVEWSSNSLSHLLKG